MSRHRRQRVRRRRQRRGRVELVPLPSGAVAFILREARPYWDLLLAQYRATQLRYQADRIEREAARP
jgi:hypothetical protein